MRTALIFIFIFTGALLVGAIAAYPVYKALALVNEMEFERVISRTTLVSGLVFALLYLRLCGLFSLAGVGLKGGEHNGKNTFVIAVISGVLIIAVLGTSLMSLGIYQLDARVDKSLVTMLWVVIKALLTGLFVGLIEETIFRGALFGGLNKQANATVALLVTSLVYAALHFLNYLPLEAGVEIGWFTGVEIFPDALYRFSNPITIDSFITLFILGALFSFIRIRTNSIILCIAFHAGIVAALKVLNYLTNYASGSKYDFLVNEYDHQFGYLASGILLLAMLAYHLMSSSKPGRQADAI